ncbi:hypothetical protein [Mycoplasmopsis fermentans]|uniref:Uncharacterized protein n=1 Tax=Mycoplasmopsis fermentans (strain M64) TaxID=943945 RepID=A0AB32XC43_MYCFM|nr:hypothetical protein [Mycoplasmopsis fermentans]ADV34551.1 Hypothetical Protein MfeM64YM_0553 [Mycoplasmopsis fermentans M64]VEU64107.1 Uncharacterised protein [Mycoplasmopsis fermentans]VEU66746.1 Uncharacterised protein [Mesomycoplasma conjunctivae]
MIIHATNCQCPACMLKIASEQINNSDNTTKTWAIVLITLAVIILISITIYLAIKLKKDKLKKITN